MFPTILVIYLVFINLLAFLLMGWDKRKAKHKAWRLSEQSLLTVAAVGGSVGIYLGSSFWRHKTQKQSFRRPFYGIVLGQVLLLVALAYFYYQ